MSNDEAAAELSIGQVASMTRLTIRALRHYDDIGLLRPARVDRRSGYRYYATDQIAVAGTIAVLRGLEISTTTIAALLGGDIDIGTIIEQELARPRGTHETSRRAPRRIRVHRRRRVTDRDDGASRPAGQSASRSRSTRSLDTRERVPAVRPGTRDISWSA